MPARIFQLNVSTGGVPKRAVARARVTRDGIEGDAVADRRHHGGPDRAVCVYSLERILALQEEGATAFPGALGENITTVGLDWERVVPGTRLKIGDALIEVVSYTTPCATTSPYVRDDVKRFHQDHHPGWSRVYARVLQEGTLRAGLAITFEPDG